MSFREIFEHINCHGDQKYQRIYELLKPRMIEAINKFLLSRHKCHTGRPITTDFSKFLDAMFFVSESGSQFRYVKQVCGLSKSTFHRYLKIVSDHHIVEEVYEEVIKECSVSDLMITDTFTVKSMRGSVGLGSNPTDRGRKGFKVSLICDTNRVTRSVEVGGANVHDTKMLIKTIDHIPHPEQMVTCLCDAGYVGKELKSRCHDKNFRLIVKPRRTCKHGKMTHILLKKDSQLLKNNRNQIELLNGHIRRFRGLMIKWVRDVSIYTCLLYVALLCITCYQLYVKH